MNIVNCWFIEESSLPHVLIGKATLVMTSSSATVLGSVWMWDSNRIQSTVCVVVCVCFYVTVCSISVAITVYSQLTTSLSPSFPYRCIPTYSLHQWL